MYSPHKSDLAVFAAATQGLERHMLVWLTESGWNTLLAAAQPQHRAGLYLWQGQNWPAIVRRFETGARKDEICLGLPLPPDAASGEKIRIPLRANVADIDKVAPAVELWATLREAGEWRDRLATLERDAAGMQLRLYGSLAMQTMTGLVYLRPDSDIDILFHPRSRRHLEDGLAVLSRHAAHLPLDGEIVFPGGQAVSWKEWRSAISHPAKVLVKELHSVRLADPASLLATLEPV